MDKTTVDFSKVIIKDIDGKEISVPEFHKIIANTIYLNTQSVDMLDLSLEINKFGMIGSSRVQIGELKNLLTNKQSPLKAFVKQALLEFFDDILKEIKEE